MQSSHNPQSLYLVRRKARLFYALWPGDHTRQKLAEISRQLGKGKTIPPENLHITLLFLGQVDEHIQNSLIDVSSTVHCHGFTLELTRFGLWKRSAIFWMAPAQVPGQLISLVNYLSEIAASHGILLDRRPYQPHVSLARKVRTHVKLEARKISWPVSEFSLVESKTLPEGAKYRLLKTWPLT